MIDPILRRARKGNSRRIIMEARLPHFSHNPRPAPFSAPPRNTNPIPGRILIIRVERNNIRPTDGHARGRINLIPTQKSIPRIKRGLIPIRFSIPRPKTNLKTPIFSFIRPLSWSFVGRMQYAPTQVPEKMAIFFCTG